MISLFEGERARNGSEHTVSFKHPGTICTVSRRDIGIVARTSSELTSFHSCLLLSFCWCTHSILV